ncbi:MAG: lipopolysaccharide biosynthesis protein [Planctomycetaceae bacterium]
MTNAAAPNKHFLYKSAIYAIGDLLTKGSRFVLIPFYAHTFSTEEVGLLAILLAINIAAWTLMSIGFGFGVRRFHVEEEQHANQADVFLSSMFWSRAFAAIPLLGILLLAGVLFCQNTTTAIPMNLMLISIVSGYFRAGLNVYENALMAREQAVRYRAFTFSLFTSTTLAIICAVVVLDLGLAGAIYAEALLTTIWGIGIAIFLTRKAKPNFSIVTRDRIRCCLPVVPHMFFAWALASSDRILLERFGVSTDRIGVYDVGYMLASTLGVFSVAMRSAWFPGFFRTAKDPDANQRYGETATLYFCVVAAVGVGLILLAPECVALLTPETYANAVPIMRLVVVGSLFLTIFVAANQPMFFANKTGVIAATSFLGLLTNLAANFLLIPRYGEFGAAISTIIGYSVMATAMLLLVQRQFKVRWSYESLGTLLAGAAVAVAMGLLPNWSGVPGMAGRGIIAIGFATGCLLVGRRQQIAARLAWKKAGRDFS